MPDRNRNSSNRQGSGSLHDDEVKRRARGARSSSASQSGQGSHTAAHSSPHQNTAPQQRHYSASSSRASRVASSNLQQQQKKQKRDASKQNPEQSRPAQGGQQPSQQGTPQNPNPQPAYYAQERRPHGLTGGRTAAERAHNAQLNQGRQQRSTTRPPKEQRRQNRADQPFLLRNIRIFIPIAIVILIIIVGGIVDIASSWGRIHPGVKVQGVDVGGMTVEEAADTLDAELSPILESSSVEAYATAQVAAEDGYTLEALPTNPNKNLDKAASDEDAEDDDSAIRQWTVKAESLGATIDAQDSAEEAYAVGRSFSTLFSRFTAWFGAINKTAQFTYDEESVENLESKIDKKIGTKVSEFRIKVSDKGKAAVKDGHDGWKVTDEAFRTAYETAVFDTETPCFVIPMEDVPVHITAATAQKVVDSVQSTIDQGINFTYRKSGWEAGKADLGSLISQKVLEPNQRLDIEKGSEEVVDDEDGIGRDSYAKVGTDETSGWTLQAYVNFKKADEYLIDELGEDKAFGNAVDASFDVSSGEVEIIESQEGKGPDRDEAALAIQDALFEDGSRDIAINVITIQPDISTEDAQGMGIKERIAGWQIPLSGTDARIHNITLLCELIDGSIVAPGDTWSFNDTTGERTSEKGFKEASTIVNGRHEDQLGGGICQVATCVYNAVCYSGLEIVTRTNHDFYIPAYDDEGFNDATVSWDGPDFAWANDTDNYLLVSAGIDDGNVTVSIWGTDEHRKVKCERGEWKEGDKYKTIREEDDELAKGTETVDQSGVDGRSITIRYYVESKDGEVLHDVDFFSVYQAQDEIIKIGTKTSSSSSDSSSKKDSDSGDSD